ncbi:site-specific integrase [Synechococcus sp. SYN20]|uniref:tyrosine-type recombinase/integrase n=1 Tax=Synechococcus sp. SYN20 TaxID=1050714 RepID=UPI0021023CEF|nr:site-specific integrase [Synechococcus sp. SYN20]
MPPKLSGAIGCAMWRRKAGNTIGEAKRNALVFLEETDELIRKAKGEQLDPEQQILSLMPDREQLKKDMDREGIDLHEVIGGFTREPMYLDDIGTPNHRYVELHELATGVLDGTAKPPKTADDLITLATLLKGPAVSTRKEWERHLEKLMEHSQRQFITALTREDALAYRQHLLSTTAASTTKTRLRFLSGLFNVAVDEGWIDTNPFEGLTKRIRSKATVKEVVRLDEADKNWYKLPKHHQLLWHILRWSGSHASEAAGLRWEDIDLDNGTISFKAHETRPLKNVFRERVIPIHPKLMEIFKGVDGDSSGLIFPWAYNPKRARWAEGMHWNDILGVSPKATRDWAASCLRMKDVNERTIGKLFGHSPSKTSITGVYGSVDIETMRRALDQLE